MCVLVIFGSGPYMGAMTNCGPIEIYVDSMISVHIIFACTKFCVDTDIFEEVINDKLISVNMYLCMGAMGNLGSIVTILNIINL